MAYRSFEELDVWKRGCKLAVEIYFALRDSRDFSLRDQMNKAAVSIPSNIAEGAERDSNPEFIRFLNIAKGSSAELRTQLYIAGKIEILKKSQILILVEETKEISSMLQGLINSIKTRPPKPKTPKLIT